MGFFFIRGSYRFRLISKSVGQGEDKWAMSESGVGGALTTSDSLDGPPIWRNIDWKTAGRRFGMPRKRGRDDFVDALWELAADFLRSIEVKPKIKKRPELKPKPPVIEAEFEDVKP